MKEESSPRVFVPLVSIMLVITCVILLSAVQPLHYGAIDQSFWFYEPGQAALELDTLVEKGAARPLTTSERRRVRALLRQVKRELEEQKP